LKRDGAVGSSGGS